MSTTIGLIVLFSLYAEAASTDIQATTPSVEDQALQRERLQEEIRKLKLENLNSVGVRGFFRAYAPFLTGLGAIAGVLVTIWRHNQEQTSQREKDRLLRKIEGQRHVEERFSAVLTDLGAESEPTRAGAAVSLLTFLHPDYVEFHHQVRLITLANLKVAHPDTITSILIRVFEAAMRTPEKFDPVELDLSNARLGQADLSGLDLSGADLRLADLSKATLTDTTLRQVQGYQVSLRDARLSGANVDAARFPEAHCEGAKFYDANLHAVHFEGADLRGAHFQRSRLQSAHFDGADLRGATFQDADINDTYFRNARFDDGVLKSITRARNWEHAHFSEGVMSQLQQFRRKEDTERIEKPDRDEGP